MIRLCQWISLAALSLCAGVVSAQEVSALRGDGQPQDEDIPVIELKIYPARETFPAMRYRLLPELRDRKQGNAVLHYYRAFSPEWANVYQRPEFQKILQEWTEKLDTDRGKLPPEGMRIVVRDQSIKCLDRGARSTHCDWNMLPRLREEGFEMLIPDVQSFRLYTWLLSAKVRFQMGDKKFDEAAYTLQTGLQLGKDISAGPTLVQSLVGAAITSIHLRDIEEWVQYKDSPNLYWALTNLPTPLVDLRSALEGERIVGDYLFPRMREMIKDVEARPMSPSEMEELLKNVIKLRSVIGGNGTPQYWAERTGFAIMAARSYAEGKKFLLKQGRPKELVERMPITQVALIYELQNYDSFFDDMVKWYGLPYQQVRNGLKQAENRLIKAKSGSPTLGVILAALLVPAADRVMMVPFRVERKIACLRVVEAIRLHAEAQGGKLPNRLEDIKEVPIPLDPLTGGHFEYTRDGDTATLTATVPPGETVSYSKSRGNSWRYVLKIQH